MGQRSVFCIGVLVALMATISLHAQNKITVKPKQRVSLGAGGTASTAVVSADGSTATTSSGEAVVWTAPAVAGTYTVTAASAADPTKTVSWEVTVLAQASVSGFYVVQNYDGPVAVFGACGGPSEQTDTWFNYSNVVNLTGDFDEYEISWSRLGFTYSVIDSGSAASLTRSFSARMEMGVCFRPTFYMAAISDPGERWRAKVRKGGGAWVISDAVCL